MSGSAFDGHDEEIFEAVANAERMEDIAARYARGHGALIKWLTASPERSDAYARAREIQAHRWGAQIVEISDRSDLAPDDRRVRIDARKWVAQRFCRSVYGDHIKQDTDVTHHVTADAETVLRSLLPEALGK